MRIVTWAALALALLLSPAAKAADPVTATARNLTNRRVSLDISAVPGADVEAYRVALKPFGTATLPVSLSALRRDAGLSALISAGVIRVDLSGGIPVETWEFEVAAGTGAALNLAAAMPYGAKLIGASMEVTTGAAGTATLLSGSTTISAAGDTSSAAIVEMAPASFNAMLTRGSPLILQRTDDAAALIIRVQVLPTSL